MKNYFNLIIVLSFAFIFGACQKESNLSQTNNYDEVYNTQNERLDAKRKFVIRHSGYGSCVCEGCKCPGCPCPLGVCTCFWEPFDPSMPDLTQAEIDSDIGSLFIYKLNNSQVKLVFNQRTALDNNYVPFGPDDLFLSLEESTSLGFNQRIKLVSGLYKADFSENKYGEIIVNVKAY